MPGDCWTAFENPRHIAGSNACRLANIGAKVELIINLTTAKALGIKVPLTLLGRADEVME